MVQNSHNGGGSFATPASMVRQEPRTALSQGVCGYQWAQPSPRALALNPAYMRWLSPWHLGLRLRIRGMGSLNAGSISRGGCMAPGPAAAAFPGAYAQQGELVRFEEEETPETSETLRIHE